jgi:hypothetical protein
MLGDRRLSRGLGGLVALGGLLALGVGPARAGGFHHGHGTTVGVVGYSPVGVGTVWTTGVAATPMVGYGVVQAPTVGFATPLTSTLHLQLPQVSWGASTPSMPAVGLGATPLAVPGGVGVVGGSGGTQYVWTLVPAGSLAGTGSAIASGAGVPSSILGSDEYRVLTAQTGGAFADALVNRLKQELQRLIAASGGTLPNRDLLLQALLLVARDFFAQSNGGALFDMVLRPIIERIIGRLIDENQPPKPTPAPPPPPITPAPDANPSTLPAGTYRIEGIITIRPQGGGDGGGGDDGGDNSPPPSNGLPQGLKNVNDPGATLAPEVSG